jgi:hypothetical protein
MVIEQWTGQEPGRGRSKIHPRLLESEPLQRCRLEECQGACCLHGVWVDVLEINEIRAHADLIRPHMPAGSADPDTWFDDERETDGHSLSGTVRPTRVIDAPEHYGGTACVFLREDFKCALQVAGEAAELHPWRFKPFYCILHPLDLDDQGRLTLDDTALLLDEPGSCLRLSPFASPLSNIFTPELRYLLGEKGYQQAFNHSFVAQSLDGFQAGGPVGRIDAEEEPNRSGEQSGN